LDPYLETPFFSIQKLTLSLAIPHLDTLLSLLFSTSTERHTQEKHTALFTDAQWSAYSNSCFLKWL